MRKNSLTGIMSASVRAYNYLVLVLALLLSSPALAGELSLANGDRISGALKGIQSTNIIWHSPVLGKMRIDRAEVISIKTDVPITIELNPSLVDSKRLVFNACVFSRSPAGSHLMQCDEGIEILLDELNEIGLAYAEPDFKEEYIKHTGLITLRAENERKSTKSRELDLDAYFQVRYAATRHTLRLDYDTEKVDKEKIENELKATYKYDYFISDMWFVYGNGAYERDEFKDLEQKYSVAAGPGYQFFEHELGSLELEGGLQYQSERFKSDKDRNQLALRWALDFKWLLSSYGIEFFHDHQVTVVTDQLDDYDLESRTGLRFPIIDHLNALLQYDYDYDNNPSDDASKIESVMSMGVTLSW